MYYAIMPFCVWNHMFLCIGSQYDNGMCLFCTKTYLKSKKASKYIEKKLFVDVLDYFSVQFSHGIISDGQVHLFVHSSVINRQKIFDENGNLGMLFYEVINSPFLVWKFYLNILTRIVFNYIENYVLPTVLSGSDDDCRNHTACTPFICFGLKKQG